MIDTSNETRCKNPSCGKPVQQIPGHRKREYCNNTCKQTAYRLRKEDHHDVTIVDESIQQRIAALEHELAQAHYLIDEYINRKRTPPEWKKQLQERFLQHGKGADWPALSIHVPLASGERAYRVFELAASNELLEWASVALRNRDQS